MSKYEMKGVYMNKRKKSKKKGIAWMIILSLIFAGTIILVLH